MNKDFGELGEEEGNLVQEHMDNHKKIERSISDGTIRRLQKKNKKIRDKLVNEYGWSRQEANRLVE